MANLALARQRYQRRRLAWEMALPAAISIHRGDVVWLTHSLLDGGVSGRASGADGTRLSLSRPLDVAAGSHDVLVALPDGRVHQTTTTIAEAGTVSALTLAAAVPDPMAGDPEWEAADLRWWLYDGTGSPRQVRITSIDAAPDRARVTAVDEAAAYHAAATSNLAGPDGSRSALAGGPRVEEIYAWTRHVEGSVGDVAVVHVLIHVSGAWEGGTVLVSGADTGPKAVLEPFDREASWVSPATGTLAIRVVPAGNPGGAKEISYQVTITHPVAFRAAPWSELYWQQQIDPSGL